MSGRTVHRRVTLALSAAMIAIGIAVLVRTVAAAPGGLAVGYLIGVGLVTAGCLRVYVARRS